MQIKGRKLKEIRLEHEDYLRRVKENGGNTIPVKCPHCGKEWENTAPKDKKSVWDSWTIHPCCGKGSFNVYRRDSSECYSLEAVLLTRVTRKSGQISSTTFKYVE